MIFGLRLLCVFLTFNVTPNEASNVDRVAVKRDVERYSHRDNRRVREARDDTKLQSLYIAKKPILRQGFKNENGLSMSRIVNQVIDNRNIYKERDAYRSDDSHEERNNKFEDTDDSTVKDRNGIETQKIGLKKILALLLLDGQSISSSSSLESDRNTQDNNLFYDYKNDLRSGAWKSCGKKASKVCRKACEEAIKRGCRRSDCKSKAKKRMKKDCKTTCKDRFGIEEEVEVENKAGTDKSSPQVPADTLQALPDLTNVEFV